MKKNKHVGKLIWLIVSLVIIALACAWVYLIYHLSSQDGADTLNTSLNWSRRIAKIMYGSTDGIDIYAFDMKVRKWAHIALFFVLGFLLLEGVRLLLRNFNILIPIDIAIFATGAYAYYDEWHKQFISGRHFQIEEVILNFEGALAGMAAFIVCFVIYRAIRRLVKKVRNGR